MRLPRRDNSQRLNIIWWVVVATVVTVGNSALLTQRAVLPGLAGCRTLRDQVARYACLTSRVEAALRDDGVAATARTLVRLRDRRDITDDECHRTMHPIGERDAATDTPLKLAKDDFCTQGYLHGRVVRVLSRGSDVAAVTAAMLDRCPQVDGVGLGNCVHSAGHALVRVGGLPRALEACAGPGLARADRRLERPSDWLEDVPLLDTVLPPLRVQCGKGASMEQGFRAGSAGAALHACDGVAAAHRIDCLAWVGLRSKSQGVEPESVAAYCLRLLGLEARICAASYAASLPGSRCALLDGPARAECTATKHELARYRTSRT